ncbi:MAG: sporulation integral membrane protein YtvI [Ruminococcaceae bacterium]|nr:sporulation integral membrane protein YtvI [Oscillospiraceae bacterium]
MEGKTETEKRSMKGGMILVTEKKRKFIIDVVFVAIILALAHFTIEYLAVWVLPFIIGLIVAIILQKPVAYLTEKTKLGRGFWSCLLVLVSLCAVFGLIALLGWALYEESPGFAKWLTSLVPSIKNTFDNVSVWFSGFTKMLPGGAGQALESAPTNIFTAVISGVTGLITTIAEKIITDGPGLLIACIFSVVASCYITKDYRKIVNFVVSQFGQKGAKIIVSTKQLFVTNILKMLRGYIIIMFITYIELFIALTILRVDYAAILAALIAVLDIMPVVGTGTVLIPWFVISLLMGNFGLAAGVIITYIAITIIRNIIEPRIIGQQVGLPPIVTLIAMYVGLKLYGVLGMMLLPVTIIVIVKLQENGIIHIWNTPKKSESDKEEEKKKPLFTDRFSLRKNKQKQNK